MPVLVGCLALSAPRFAILLVVFFSDYIGRAYLTVVWPFIGFLFTATDDAGLRLGDQQPRIGGRRAPRRGREPF